MRQQIIKQRADMLAESTGKPGVIVSRRNNTDIAMNPCKCLVRGQVLDMLTYPHAKKCGYENKYEMIRKGLVVPI